jgi:hypothetical protein
MTATEYLKENSDWFDKSPGGEKLYFESEVIKMMKNYSSQTEISDEEIEKVVHRNINYGGGSEGWIKDAFKKGAKWYREQLKQNK